MQQHNSMPFTFQTLDHSGNTGSTLASDGMSTPSGNPSSSPVMAMTGSLQSPAYIHPNVPSRDISGFLEREKLIQSFHERECQFLKEALVRAREQYDTLKYVL